MRNQDVFPFTFEIHSSWGVHQHQAPYTHIAHCRNEESESERARERKRETILVTDC